MTPVLNESLMDHQYAFGWPWDYPHGGVAVQIFPKIISHAYVIPESSQTLNGTARRDDGNKDFCL